MSPPNPTFDHRRHPPLKGGINFRDFGGYATADGGRVKWGKLFRSGFLSRLDGDSHAALAALGVAAVCDFRTDVENDHEPTRLPPPLHIAVKRLHIWPKASRTMETLVKDLHAGLLTEGEVFAQQDAVYREFVVDFAHRYAEMFRHIMGAGGRPVLIHCMAGKDRTGLGAALIQMALGVPEEAIHHDFLLTNKGEGAVKAYRSLARQVAREMGITGPAELERLQQQCGRLYYVRSDSLSAAFAAIRQSAGSIDGYFATALKLTAADRDRLKDWFVEAV